MYTPATRNEKKNVSIISHLATWGLIFFPLNIYGTLYINTIFGIMSVLHQTIIPN